MALRRARRGTHLFSTSSLAEPLAEASDELPLPDLGAVVGGRYRLVARLGEGQFGRVYRAERTDLAEHHVALKVLRSTVYAGRDAEHELRLLSAVAHPNIVQLADHGLGPGYVWFTMPLYEGQTLDTLVSDRPLSCREAHEVFAPIAEGLEVLHAVGLRHQDVKPENLFLASFQRSRFPLLLDLGAAAPARATLPVAGTLVFAAPEQVRALLCLLRGELSSVALDETIDTYGFASTLLRCLVGEEHFPGQGADDAAELADIDRALSLAHHERATNPIRTGALPGLRGQARADLAACFRRWLCLDPELRPTMKQLRSELGVLLAGEAQEQRRRQWRRAAVATMVGAGLLGLGAGLWKQQQDLDLGRCHNDLVGVQRQAIEKLSSLDECKGMLSTQSGAAQSCQIDLRAEQARSQLLASTQGAQASSDASRWLARIDRCEHDRRQAATTCSTDLDELSRQQRAAVHDRDEARAERDAARTERESLRTERDALKVDHLLARTERDNLRAEQSLIRTEREALKSERDALQSDLSSTRFERDALRTERDALLVRSERRRPTASAPPPPEAASATSPPAAVPHAPPAAAPASAAPRLGDGVPPRIGRPR
jgi:FtsZ-binding cell division protein ZapB